MTKNFLWYTILRKTSTFFCSEISRRNYRVLIGIFLFFVFGALCSYFFLSPGSPYVRWVCRHGSLPGSIKFKITNKNDEVRSCRHVFFRFQSFFDSSLYHRFCRIFFVIAETYPDGRNIIWRIRSDEQNRQEFPIKKKFYRCVFCYGSYFWIVCVCKL